MNPYLRNQVMTASPGKLIIMLYDGLIQYMELAQDGFLEKDLKKRIEVTHENLIGAQRILNELQGSLNMEQGGEIAVQLRDLYTSYYVTLIQANMLKDSSKIPPVLRMVRELREAWCQIVDRPQALVLFSSASAA